MRKCSHSTFISVNTPNYGLRKVNSHLHLFQLQWTRLLCVLRCCFIPTQARQNEGDCIIWLPKHKVPRSILLGGVQNLPGEGLWTCFFFSILIPECNRASPCLENRWGIEARSITPLWTVRPFYMWLSLSRSLAGTMKKGGVKSFHACVRAKLMVFWSRQCSMTFTFTERNIYFVYHQVLYFRSCSCWICTSNLCYKHLHIMEK